MSRENEPETKRPVFWGKSMIAALAGIVILLAAILVIVMVQAGQETVVPPGVCGPMVVSYVNQNLASEGSIANLVSIKEKQGMYELKIDYQSQVVSAYTTKDCTLLFTSVITMTTGPDGQATAPVTRQPARAPVKSARPAVDLYVMAFCPYGTQAETAMDPVADLLKAKADIRVRYITTVSGTGIDSVNSLHGPAEAKEDLIQLCINTYYPGQFWSYLETFNQQCYPSWQNATALESCRESTLAALSLDRAKIDTCASGTEGITLLKADAGAADKDGASASPTLVINGVAYAGARTPEAYKQAICNSFETAPAECSTVLSSATVSGAVGGC